jgi:hypothetical protein
MRACPGDQGADCLQQASAERGEPVLDAGRDDGVDGAGHQPVAFQVAKGQRQHPLADPLDLAAQLTEPAGTASEQFHHQERPLVCQPVKQVPDLTGHGGLDIRRYAGSGITGVTDGH